jgi:hypothetical protein
MVMHKRDKTSSVTNKTNKLNKNNKRKTKMKSLRFLDRRAGYSLASIGMLLGVISPAVIPAFVSADTLSSRSIEMSSSDADATAKYTITFTPTADFQNLVIDWCSDSPIVGNSTCAAPTGFDAKTGVTLTATSVLGTTAFDGANSTATHTEITGTSDSGTSAVTFELNGVHNPSTVGTFYARIYTYGATQNYTDFDTLGTTVDTGGIALSVNDSFGVTAAVRESLTFCVSHAAPGPNCGAGAGTDPDDPSMILGQGTGDDIALDSATVSSYNNYVQLSTNAEHGAVVRLTNSTGCGGLKRVGAAGCDIPAATSDLVAGTAGFGVKFGTAASVATATGATGTIVPATGYSTSSYFMDNTTSNDNVSSPYGGSILNTSGAPVSNKQIVFTTAAAISNGTPAGLYKATLNMIASGTF